MDEPIVILCTVPSVEVGEALGRGLVEAGLAACVNVVPGLLSIYRWEGEVQVDREAQLLIKTRASLLEPVSEHVRASHPYEVPELLALPSAGGSEAYLAWIRSST
ncbi:MAG: divalent-cation tolerance protein CutA [Myxococcota bacterium]|nr:divalent-cation tolerance protein CutA [Myxococcota bacterium]